MKDIINVEIELLKITDLTIRENTKEAIKEIDDIKFNTSAIFSKMHLYKQQLEQEKNREYIKAYKLVLKYIELTIHKFH